MKAKSTQQQFTNPILLTPAQLKVKKDQRKEQLLIIDVRGWLEYGLGHLPGARRLNQNSILKEISKDQAIVLTCLSGHRSAIVAQGLISQGYRQVYNLQGGLLAWQSAGYAVQRGLAG